MMGKRKTIFNAAKNGINALCELIKEYESIGTVDECRSAMNKQIPKRPIPYNPWNGKCPVCNIVFTNNLMNYCGSCGQKLDWGE